MALEKIKGEKAILALKPGAGRLNDGGGLYLAAFAWGQSHYWRMDYSHQGRRRTLSLGVYPEVDLNAARAFAREVRAKLASGVDPMNERQQQRTEQQIRAEEQSLIKAGLPLSGSFESVARRWFSVKKHGWMQSYSSKVIRRLELHAFPRFGGMPIGQITARDASALRRLFSNPLCRRTNEAFLTAQSFVTHRPASLVGDLRNFPWTDSLNRAGCLLDLVPQMLIF